MQTAQMTRKRYPQSKQESQYLSRTAEWRRNSAHSFQPKGPCGAGTAACSSVHWEPLLGKGQWCGTQEDCLLSSIPLCSPLSSLPSPHLLNSLIEWSHYTVFGCDPLKSLCLDEFKRQLVWTTICKKIKAVYVSASKTNKTQKSFPVQVRSSICKWTVLGAN